jgi:hypothetical protein
VSWHSTFGRVYKPNVFYPNFSWYQDKPSDDPMRAQKLLQAQQQEPRVETPQVAASFAPPTAQTAGGRQGSALWLLLAIAVAAVALFAFFA